MTGEAPELGGAARDLLLKISYGANRYAKKWVNKRIAFEDLCERFRAVLRTPESVEEYAAARKTERDRIKDVGGFVMGHLRGGVRKKGTVESRSAVTLDADRAPRDFRDVFAERIRRRCALYSTHSHTPEAPRLRLVFPLAREVSAEEYVAVGRLLADEIGIDFFDDTTYEPERLMYWPSAPSNGEYVFELYGGDDADPDEILSRVSDWRDWSLLPTSSRQSELIRHELTKAEDPLTKRGVIGAFCRSYSIQEAIEAFLSDVYAPTVREGQTGAPSRYDYIPGEGTAGVVLYDDRWAYSHHATDPASGRLLNAFDLVRFHRFSDFDTEPQSVRAMTDFALNDERVRLKLAAEKQEQARADFAPPEPGTWQALLERARDGTLKNTLRNLQLILENDEGLSGIAFNELADELEALDGLPWDLRSDSPRRRFWRDADDAQLVSYVDARYGSFSERHFHIAVTKVTDDRRYHPIREYLSALPAWDGVKRVETLLIDYLGAADTPYTRAATRKTLCAAVARVLWPGTKFDHILVLCGAQGVGKSTLIARLGGEWFTDSLSLTDMEDKTGAEKLQGKWLIEIGELAGMRKADIDRVKSFISRQDDRFRASFGRRATSHPRQCVFFGTTNNDDGFLRDTSGNRRFWVVGVSADSLKKSWQLDEETTSQIWAEAHFYVRRGETLYFPKELEAAARIEQVRALEADEREGLVQAYLDVPLPESWEKMDIYTRQAYIRYRDDPTHEKGTILRTSVSNIEIWVECFGKKAEDLKPQDSYQISRVMSRMEGWEKRGARVRIGPYGMQRIYERTDTAAETVGAFGQIVRWNH